MGSRGLPYISTIGRILWARLVHQAAGYKCRVWTSPDPYKRGMACQSGADLAVWHVQALRPCRLRGQELRRGLERNKTLNRVHGARWRFPNVYRTPEGAFRPYCKSTETNTNWPSPLNEANRIRASGLQSYGGNAPDSRPTLGRCGPCHTTRFAFRAVEPCKVDLTLVPGHPREQLACLSVPDVYRTVPPRSRLGAVWTVLVVKGGLRFFSQLAYLGSVFGVPNLDWLIPRVVASRVPSGL